MTPTRPAWQPCGDFILSSGTPWSLSARSYGHTGAGRLVRHPPWVSPTRGGNAKDDLEVDFQSITGKLMAYRGSAILDGVRLGCVPAQPDGREAGMLLLYPIAVAQHPCMNRDSAVLGCTATPESDDAPRESDVVGFVW